jgi:hypothetical protein
MNHLLSMLRVLLVSGCGISILACLHQQHWYDCSLPVCITITGMTDTCLSASTTLAWPLLACLNQHHWYNRSLPVYINNTGMTAPCLSASTTLVWPLLACLYQQHWYDRSLSVCINNTGMTAFKYSDLLQHTSLWQVVLSILGSQLLIDLHPFYFFRHHKMHYCLLLLLGAHLWWKSSLLHAH